MVAAKKYEVVIGLEVHAQLLTSSKMFCACPNDYLDSAPNSVACPVCLGMPGVMPVINKRAVEFVITTGLALNSTISARTQFHRKNYPYPDLMKGYQISQYDGPIAEHGSLEIEVSGQKKLIRITRVHLEEDVAKLHHIKSPEGKTYSLVDVNRSGIPLMETVSEPDMRSPEEAREYLIKLRSVLQYLNVSTGNMEDGSFRCDANISIRPMGTLKLFPKVEIKNMNSLRAVYKALEYEIQRQTDLVEGGGAVIQETRGWIDENEITVSQRAKEDAHDYRYFPEPDLPPIEIEQSWIESIKCHLPELQSEKLNRFMAEYQLGHYDANLITGSKPMADFFEEALMSRSLQKEQIAVKAKTILNWIVGDLTSLLNANNIEIRKSMITPELIRDLTDQIDSEEITGSAGKIILDEMFRTGKSSRVIADSQGLTRISNQEILEVSVNSILEENPKAVQDYLSGRDTAIKFLLGQVMKQTRGRANPVIITEMLEEKLSSMELS